MAVHMGSVDTALNTAKKVQEYISVGFDTCIDVAFDLAEHEREHGSSGSGPLGDLREVMMEYCLMEKQMNDAVAAAEAVKGVVRQGELGEDESIVTLFDSKLEAIRKESSDNFEEHRRLKEFDQRMEEVGNSDESPDGGTLVTEEVDDEEIEWVQTEVVTKCPYTGKEMVKPVKNKHCKHNYDKDGILQFIKTRGSRAKCPVAGCANTKPLAEADLEDNVELKKIIARKNRQAGKKKR